MTDQWRGQNFPQDTRQMKLRSRSAGRIWEHETNQQCIPMFQGKVSLRARVSFGWEPGGAQQKEKGQ